MGFFFVKRVSRPSRHFIGDVGRLEEEDEHHSLGLVGVGVGVGVYWSNGLCEHRVC